MTVDTTTKYLGLSLRNPVMASSSPLTGDIDTLLQLQEAGAAAVVLPSLFEEQIEHDAMVTHHVMEFASGINAEASEGYFPELDEYNTGPRQYLDLLRDAKEQLDIPVIASLNGTSAGGWTLYARILEDAGADALELNAYWIAADPSVNARDVERRYLRLVDSVRRSTSLPLAIKLSPYFSSTGHMVRSIAEAGADGVVLFNRFYQPDIDLEQLDIRRDLALSTPFEMRLVLRWMAILCGRVPLSLGATTGVATAEDVVKLVLAGADVTMAASSLLRHGPQHMATLVDGMAAWFGEHEYTSVAQGRGSLSQRNVPDPAAFERANYMRILTGYSPDRTSDA